MKVDLHGLPLLDAKLKSQISVAEAWHSSKSSIALLPRLRRLLVSSATAMAASESAGPKPPPTRRCSAPSPLVTRFVEDTNRFSLFQKR